MQTARWYALGAALTLALTTANPLAAQSADERTTIGVTVLSAWGKVRGLPTYRPDSLLFEPSVLRGWWEKGVHPDTSVARVRDSTEIARFTAALGAKAVTPELAAACAGRTVFDVKADCPTDLRGSHTVAMGDPHVMGDSATVLLRTGPVIGLIGNNRALAGRNLSLFLIKLVRRENRWSLYCATMAQGDAIPPPGEVEGRCKPTTAGEGG